LAKAKGSIVLSVSTASPDRDVYKQGEDASPIIGLKAAIGAMNEQIRKPFEFHFVEESGVSRPH
jgi:hypothetical protein